jgi:hypothetical protein
MNEQQVTNMRVLIAHMEGLKRTLNMNSILFCGAPACVLGEMYVIPHFKGLGFNQEDCSTNEFESASKFFGLEIAELYGLFGMADGMYQNYWKRADITGQQWSKRAREILAAHGHSVDEPTMTKAIDPHQFTKDFLAEQVARVASGQHVVGEQS